MVSKLVKLSMISAFALLYSAQSLATFGNCNSILGESGKVVAVSLGYDDNADVNIAFNFKYGSVVKTVSVKRTIGDSAGNGMFRLLLSAQLTQSTFKVINCLDDQLIAGEIRVD